MTYETCKSKYLTKMVDHMAYPKARKLFCRCITAMRIKEGRDIERTIIAGKGKEDTKITERKLECPDHDCKYFKDEYVFERELKDEEGVIDG